MPSAADDCWRLSADCSHWAQESRDKSTRLAFRQMATAWAGLAFSEDFTSPTHELVDLAGSESSQAASVESSASPHTENEEIVPVGNPDVDLARPEQTPRAGTDNASGQPEPLSTQSPIPFTLPTHELVDLTRFENSRAAQAENTASSDMENEKIAPMNAGIDAAGQKQTSTDNSSRRRERLSLPSSIPFPKR
jgi:hypothetical protein